MAGRSDRSGRCQIVIEKMSKICEEMSKGCQMDVKIGSKCVCPAGERVGCGRRVG